MDGLEHEVGRAVGWFVWGGLAVAAASGVALTFLYEPDRLGWLRTVHSGSAAVAVISAIAAWVVRRNGHLRISGRGIVLAVVVVILVGGAFATGQMLAWEGGTGTSSGVFVTAGHGVSVDGHAVSGGDLLVAFALHLALSLCTALVLGWEYVRARWRPRSTAR